MPSMEQHGQRPARRPPPIPEDAGQPPPIPEDADQTIIDRRPLGRRGRAESYQTVDREPGIVEVGVRTEANKEKGEVNEDAIFVDEHAQRYAILDGMGGSAAGEVASARGVQFISEAGARMPEGARREVAIAVAYFRHEVARASLQIAEMAFASDKLRGMGTTCSLLQLIEAPNGGPPRQAITVQVGDSRFYRLRKGELAPITKEQSVVQALIDRGRLPPGADQVGDPDVDTRLTAEQRATVMQFRNAIHMAMGEPMLIEALKRLQLLEGVDFKKRDEIDTAVSARLAEMLADSELKERVLAAMEEFVDVHVTDVEPDDVFIGTSDGAHDPLLDREIRDIAQANAKNPGAMAMEITKAARERTRAKRAAQQAGNEVTGALERGKDDDISVLAIRVSEVPEVEAVAIPDEEVTKWEALSTNELRTLVVEYRKIMEADERLEGATSEDPKIINLVAARISRANGLRARYRAAKDINERLAVMQLDQEYKRAALEEIDRILEDRETGRSAS
ncbi:serine/threonine-protein phosphatase [Candidatus Uhrbacteria bacterium]|nr:serine/threonine-protein phosphatase [Candidatus Uhrbacteria bacterium]